MIVNRWGDLPARAMVSWWMILMAIVQTPAWTRAQVSKSSPPIIVFVCQHGAAKSVIAAPYFNKLAAERHLNFHAIARGVTPQADLSASTAAGLQKDGVPFPKENPQALSRGDVRRAVRVVAFCPVPASLAKGRRVASFDVPSPTDAYAVSRDAIFVHVKELIDELASEHKKAEDSH